jgi:hypothetical protein
MNNFAQNQYFLEEENTPHFSNNLKTFNTMHENLTFADTLMTARPTKSS